MTVQRERDKLCRGSTIVVEDRERCVCLMIRMSSGRELSDEIRCGGFIVRIEMDHIGEKKNKVVLRGCLFHSDGFLSQKMENVTLHVFLGIVFSL